MYKIILNDFEGPLDLLLKLIDDAKVDIYDIPIKKITEQYINYINSMEKMNLRVTSDFIVMASTLIEIKSKMLLPKREDDEEEDPRDELVQRLVEYKKYKEAANSLNKLANYDIKSYYKPQEDLTIEDQKIDLKSLDMSKLLKSLNNIMFRYKEKEDVYEEAEIEKEQYNISDCSEDVLKKLQYNSKLKFTKILGEKANRNKIITYFLSLLELVKTNEIIIYQDKNYSDIIIHKMDSGDKNE